MRITDLSNEQDINKLKALLQAGVISESMLEEFYARYQDPHYWTSVITFNANWGRKPA